MRVIFLDIDGVLNNQQSPYQIDEKRVKRLAKIVHKTNAKIVISSNWRHSYSLFLGKKELHPDQYLAIQRLLSYFKAYSLSIYDITGIDGYGVDSRPKEIKEYIHTHAIDSFVILDDEDVWKWDDLQPHLVLTKNGLSFFHVRKAIHILNKHPPA